jgi:hypothetical protein
MKRAGQKLATATFLLGLAVSAAQAAGCTNFQAASKDYLSTAAEMGKAKGNSIKICNVAKKTTTAIYVLESEITLECMGGNQQAYDQAVQALKEHLHNLMQQEVLSCPRAR